MKDEYAKDEYTDGKDYLDDGEEEDDEESEFEQEEREKDKRHGNTKLLTAIQVIGSLIVLAAAVALRFSGSGDYEKVRAWYFSAVNDSLITEEQSSTVKHTVVGLWTTWQGQEQPRRQLKARSPACLHPQNPVQSAEKPPCDILCWQMPRFRWSSIPGGCRFAAYP